MVVLGLGSNLGDSKRKITEAIAELKREVLRDVKVSTFYRSNALLPTQAPPEWDRPYWNAAVSGVTGFEPLALLEKIKAIEKKLGRQDRERWAPREIDIDILWMDEPFSSETLTVPHPGLLNRAFALLPFAEVAPEIATKKPFAEAREKFSLSPRLVGILNLTPDSFSDGGVFNTTDMAIKRCLELFNEGASLVDLGAESTRPGAAPLSFDDEWARLEPVLEGLYSNEKISFQKLSIDTRHWQTAERALEMGVGWINDVSGAADSRVLDAVTHAPWAKYVLMHSLSVPADRSKTLEADCDAVREVFEWGQAKLKLLEKRGLARSRVIFDPGIGFGKTSAQSFELLRGASRFGELGVETLIGHSRKSFLSTLTGKAFQERDLETVCMSLALSSESPPSYLRVHNVKMHAEALMCFEAVNGKRVN